MTADASAVDNWLTTHPYLKDTARFHQAVEDSLRSAYGSDLRTPTWENYFGEFSAGVPLLKVRALHEEVMRYAAELFASLVSGLSNTECPAEIRRDCAVLDETMRQSPGIALSIVNQVAAGAEVGIGSPVLSISPGTARFLGWRAIERVIRSWRGSLEAWLAESGWSKSYCPLCGTQPAMAQLIHTDKGRQRFLSCGCCKTRWKYLRMACVFCDTHDQNKLEVLELEQHEDFRIDVCRQCNGYIKTYTNEGDETLMLEDWSTLHLDVIAAGHGLQRRAHSLYELS